MQIGTIKFLMYYLFYKNHHFIVRELGVKTPYEALEKWYKMKPELFIKTSQEFKESIVHWVYKNVPTEEILKLPT